MQVVKMHLVLDGVVAVVVRCAIDKSGLHAATRHPHGEGFGIMIPAIGSLRGGCATKLAAPKHERILQQTPSFHIA